MGVEFDVSGVRALAADLGKASGDVRRRASQVVRKTAFDIERDAKTRAPVDTGNLKGSISVDATELEAVVGPTAEYGIYVEGGTSRMAPQPFLGPATDRHEPGFIAAMEQLSEGSL